MSSGIWNMFSCINAKQRGNLRRKITKITFGATRNETFERDSIPSQLKELMVHLARNGIFYRDLFRRPGNPIHMRNIIKDLQRGKRIEDWNIYNAYTLANVIKRYMLSLVGGILNHEAEVALLDALNLQDDMERWIKMRSVLELQPLFVQKFLAILLGIWFLMTHHDKLSEVTETQAIEGLAKAVAGSLFFNCGTTFTGVERAAKATEILISGFSTSVLLKPHWIQYFCNETGVTIVRIEKHVVELRCPANYTNEECRALMQSHVMETARKFQFQIPESEVNMMEYNAYNDFEVTSKNNHNNNQPTPKRRAFIGECSPMMNPTESPVIARLEIEYVTVNRVTSQASLDLPQTSSTLIDSRTNSSTPVPNSSNRKRPPPLNGQGVTPTPPIHNANKVGVPPSFGANADLMWLMSSHMDLLSRTQQTNRQLDSCDSQESVNAESAPFPSISARSWAGGNTHRSPGVNSRVSRDTFFHTNGNSNPMRANSTEFMNNHDYDDVPISSPEDGFSSQPNSSARARYLSWTSEIYDAAPPLIPQDSAKSSGDGVVVVENTSHIVQSSQVNHASRNITDCDYDEVAFLEPDKVMTRWFISRHIFAPSSTGSYETISS